MNVRVRMSAPAREQAKMIRAWWKRNRPKAPGLFTRELKEALDLLRASPSMGLLIGRDALRQVNLRRTRYEVSYRYDSRKKLVEIVAIWSMLRDGDPPQF